MRLSTLVLIGTLSSPLVIATAQAREPYKSRIEIVDATPYQSAIQKTDYRDSSARVYKASSNQSSGFFFSDFIGEVPEKSGSDVFDCVGGIYAVIQFPSDNHDLRNMAMISEWYNPDGELALTDEHAKYAEQQGTSYRWGGMVLRRPQGGGLFSLLDHSAGMERFIGDWRVVVTLGGLELPAQNLRVEC